MSTLVIAIDPGVKTGLAVYDLHENKLSMLETTDFWGAYDWVVENTSPHQVSKVIIERPNSKTVWHKKAMTRGAIERTSVNVGAVIREADLMIVRMKSLGYKVVRVHPSGKIDADQFAKITGWTGRTNEHMRDAGMMAWGY